MLRCHRKLWKVKVLTACIQIDILKWLKKKISPPWCCWPDQINPASHLSIWSAMINLSGITLCIHILPRCLLEKDFLNFYMHLKFISLFRSDLDTRRAMENLVGHMTTSRAQSSVSFSCVLILISTSCTLSNATDSGGGMKITWNNAQKCFLALVRWH